MSTPSLTNTVGRVRNVGSNFTTFQYAGKTIAFLERLTDSGQRPVANPMPIHPLGYPHPVDIVTPRALSAGTLTLTIRELWNQEIWQQMQGLSGSKTIVDIFRALARTPNYVTCTKIINSPGRRRYGKVYHRCVITDIQDGDDVAIGTLSVAKTMTVMYTHSTAL